MTPSCTHPFQHLPPYLGRENIIVGAWVFFKFLRSAMILPLPTVCLAGTNLRPFDSRLVCARDKVREDIFTITSVCFCCDRPVTASSILSSIVVLSPSPGFIGVASRPVHLLRMRYKSKCSFARQKYTFPLYCSHGPENPASCNVPQNHV